MDRAAGAEALGPRHGETFRHHALAGEGGVAVHQERQHRGARGLVVALLLLGARLAQHHRIDRLEMRGVGGQRQMHLVAVELAVRRGAQMIFHVARALHFAMGLAEPPWNSWKMLAIGLGHHVGEHVQPPAMRHAEHDFLHAQLAAALDDLFHRGDQRFAAVETEALGAEEFHAAEFLERLRLRSACSGSRACLPA